MKDQCIASSNPVLGTHRASEKQFSVDWVQPSWNLRLEIWFIDKILIFRSWKALLEFPNKNALHLDTERLISLTVSWWVLRCFALSEELLKLFKHPGCVQRYGLSPVWDLRCIFKFSNRLNALGHPMYWNSKDYWGLFMEGFWRI